MTKNVRRKQCERKGCRKLARPGVGLCADHEREVHEAAHPIDGVVKISELRAYKYAALDAEIRNHLLSVRNTDLEIEQARTQYEMAQKQRLAQKQAFLAAANTKKQEYEQLVQAIADEFNLDPTKMTIDPDSQVVRDLREQ
jgi:hypothetical protein